MLDVCLLFLNDALNIVQAAMYGAGCWAQNPENGYPGVAVITSGKYTPCSNSDHIKKISSITLGHEGVSSDKSLEEFISLMAQMISRLPSRIEITTVDSILFNNFI